MSGVAEGLFCERCAMFTHWWSWLSEEYTGVEVIDPFCRGCGGVVGVANEPGMSATERYLLKRVED